MATLGKASGASLDAVYLELEKQLKKHAPPFKASGGGVRGKKSFQLTVPKPVAIPGAYGRKPTELMMAAAVLQKDFVGFYLMPFYLEPQMRKKISPAVLKLLKGKTCFHVKKLDDALRQGIAAALELGAKCYKERGWA